MRPAKKRVFLSYAHADAPMIDRLVSSLNLLNCDVWRDDDSLAGGQSWWAAILEEIRECDVVVLVMSPAMFRSNACELEYNYALDLGRNVLPVVVQSLDGRELPTRLEKIQLVQFVNDDCKAGVDLGKSLILLKETQPLPTPLPDPPEAPVNYVSILLAQARADSLSKDEQERLVEQLASGPSEKIDQAGMRLVGDALLRREDLLHRTANRLQEILGDLDPPPDKPLTAQVEIREVSEAQAQNRMDPPPVSLSGGEDQSAATRPPIVEPTELDAAPNQVLERPAGHVFISYVREDSERVKRLTTLLEDAGIRVWRDTQDLWPGQDWKLEIRRAIDRGVFAFIACFSSNSENKPVSYQYEELALAADQIRRRPPGHSWLIPVRFDDCGIPEYDLGGGRTLTSLQRVDLFDNDWSKSGRLIAAIATILSADKSIKIVPPAVAAAVKNETVASRVRSMLLDPTKEIELEDLVNETVAKARKGFADQEVFPPSSEILNQSEAGMTFILQQIRLYAAQITDTAQLLMLGCAYGRPEHDALWARVVQRLALTANEVLGGNTVLINLRKLPLILAVYAASMGALERNNYSALRAVTTDAKTVDYYGAVPIIEQVHPWIPFEGHEDIARLALNDVPRKLKGLDVDISPATRRFHTPASDYIGAELEPLFMSTFTVDRVEFEQTFDYGEVMLGMIANYASARAKARGKYSHGSWIGSYAWRERGRQEYADKRILEALNQEGESWAPIRAGVFGGEVTEAREAISTFIETATVGRQRLW